MTMSAAVEARLRTIAEIRLVGGAVQFAAVNEANPPATPAAYVVPMAERPEANGLGAGGVEQRVAVELGLIWSVRNLADKRGAAAGTDLDALRRLAIESLLGWAPADGYEPLERGPSGLLAFRDGHVWWQDVFTTAYYERSQ